MINISVKVVILLLGIIFKIIFFILFIKMIARGLS